VAKPSIDVGSYLIHAPFLEITDGKESVFFWDRSQIPEITPDVTDALYVLRDGDRLDNLAQAFYKNDNLKWILQWVNNIRLEVVDMIPGTEFRVPTRDRLRRLGLVP